MYVGLVFEVRLQRRSMSLCLPLACRLHQRHYDCLSPALGVHGAHHSSHRLDQIPWFPDKDLD